ncbi:excinuclease ABC subunit UvrC [Candidatus Dojkabacteria bacterium]|nr:excinuclease ABC subunit UvrC [Candidatus Dojkabacteria bacterium]
MNFPKQLLNKIKHAPTSPGCYIYKDSQKSILYIGKAVNIRNRVSSYFSDFERLDPRIAVLVGQIRDVEFVTTDTELEALILETNLIKKYKPKYNRMMKDDKNYVWLMITRREDFPRIEFVRKHEIKTADYFGPYVNVQAIKRALKQLRKIFPFRSCKRKIYFYKNVKGEKKFFSSDKRPCLYLSLNLCDAPCTGNVSKKNYRRNINNIKNFFRSKKFKVIKDLNTQMSKLVKKQLYEKAAKVRDQLEDLAWIAQRIKIEKDMDENLWKEKREEARISSLQKLIERLKFKSLKYKENFRIECYDISNISGKSATGSMVVFIDGKPDKSSYRKFKIKTKQEPDDFLMLREVFLRRFKTIEIRLKKKKKLKIKASVPKKNTKTDNSFSTMPDLIIVDGGKGQLSSTIKVLDKLKLDIPIIGLAKKEEEIIRENITQQTFEQKFSTISLRRGSNELFLIQRIRDEAHRFAIKYHKILRSKKQIKSVLDEIPGVGEIIKKRLLKAFGSSENIKHASFDELHAIIKNKRTVENLKKLL